MEFSLSPSPVPNIENNANNNNLFQTPQRKRGLNRIIISSDSELSGMKAVEQIVKQSPLLLQAMESIFEEEKKKTPKKATKTRNPRAKLSLLKRLEACDPEKGQKQKSAAAKKAKKDKPSKSKSKSHELDISSADSSDAEPKKGQKQKSAAAKKPKKDKPSTSNIYKDLDLDISSADSSESCTSDADSSGSSSSNEVFMQKDFMQNNIVVYQCTGCREKQKKEKTVVPSKNGQHSIQLRQCKQCKKANFAMRQIYSKIRKNKSKKGEKSLNKLAYARYGIMIALCDTCSNTPLSIDKKCMHIIACKSCIHGNLNSNNAYWKGFLAAKTAWKH